MATLDRYDGMSRRRFLGLSGAALGGMVLAACGGESGTTTTTAAATTTTAAGTTTTAGMSIPHTDVTGFTVGYNNPNRMLRAPLYVGQSLGYFEEVGITDFEINDADDPVAPMLAGDYQIALFDSDVLFDAIDKGVLDARMVSVNLGSQALILCAVAGIETADDLRGKRVSGGRAGGVNEALAKYMLGELGLDWQTDVEFVTLTGGSNDWVQAALTGQIDATICFARHIPLFEAEGGKALYNDFFPWPQGGFVVRTDMMDQDFIAAWNYAYIKAQRWVKTRDNFDQLVEILSGDFGIDLPDAFFDEQVWTIDSRTLTEDLGFDPAQMDDLMNFIVPFGNVAPDINDRWRQWVDVTGLHVAQTALDLPTNPAADLSSGEEKTSTF